ALPHRVARTEASRGPAGPVRVLGHDRVGHADAASLHVHVLRHDRFSEEDDRSAADTFRARRRRGAPGDHWRGAQAGSLDETMMRKRPGWLRSLLLLSGVLVIAFLINRVGPVVIGHTFRSLSWRLLVILVFPACLAMIADTLGWRFTFAKLPRSFARLVC